jgi:hypothetical protein
MTAPATLNLDSIINVAVQVSPLAAPRPTFNQLLIVGSSTIISAATRIKKYTTLAEMAADGFDSGDPEYNAAALYFGQSPSPDALWVGRQDVAETAVEAITACRNVNFEWYVCICPSATKETHKLIAAYMESATPYGIYAFSTNDADVLAGTAGNIFEFLKGLNYKRTIGQYSTTLYAIAAIMGYAMGQNTGLANSAYTLKFKAEVGVATEDLTTTQVGIIEGNHGNLYLSFGNYYDVFEQGVMANGQFFDEVLNLDMLVNDIQLNVADLLYSSPKIPLTDHGVTQEIHAVNQACDLAVNRGFLAPGTWTGFTILNLKDGDILPNGYLVQAPSISSLSAADRSARKSPPLYVAIKEAGAIHSVIIGVYVNR